MTRSAPTETHSALIARLVEVRNDRRQYGTDITHTEHELVEAIRSSGPQTINPERQP